MWRYLKGGLILSAIENCSHHSRDVGWGYGAKATRGRLGGG
ncbi:hypothetical protein D779_2065 [Imhoffiella purpurea]|uniref:Uncharacterized protein n=1 Tax=Imhoffiella purpurea TaxID=1249627 RepID=W9V673_9GAMM|nr:hypothetical protein D779_2065 [Imhoffiella purpurea]